VSEKFEQLKEILVDKFKVSPEQVTPDATWEDLELDSLAMVELSLILESDFGLNIGDKELQELTSIDDVLRLMQERSAAI
jgi:acyl carrier protein